MHYRRYWCWHWQWWGYQNVKVFVKVVLFDRQAILYVDRSFVTTSLRVASQASSVSVSDCSCSPVFCFAKDAQLNLSQFCGIPIASNQRRTSWMWHYISHHCCDRGALSGWFSKCLTDQQTRISCIEIFIAICQVMEDIFISPLQMYRMSYCISTGVGVSIGSGGVSKMLKFYVKVVHLLDKQSCMWIFCNHFLDVAS